MPERAARAQLLLAAVLLAACGGSAPSASHSPIASPSPPGSASPAASSSPAGASPGPPSLVHCTAPVPAGDNLLIGSVVGDPTIVVRDIQDPANAKNLCAFSASVLAPRFVNAATVSYETADGEVIRADLAGGSTTVMATYAASTGAGEYSVSPDGRSVTYMDGSVWHLAGPSGNRVLATLPAMPGRGINLDEDDNFFAFSPDGQYIAFFQTFRTGGTGQTAPDQIRRANDGSLAYSTSGMTMSVWASAPTRLYFRDGAGLVHRWDPSSGPSAAVPIHWIRPRSSPDGQWIAYTVRASSGLEQFGLYKVQANQSETLPLIGRTGVVFLNNDLVFYSGERPCANCIAPQSTGVSYIYDIAGGTEVISRLSAAYDAWPHTSI